MSNQRVVRVVSLMLVMRCSCLGPLQRVGNALPDPLGELYRPHRTSPQMVVYVGHSPPTTLFQVGEIL